MIPGYGYRLVGDILMEMSFHLSQPAVYTGLTFPVTAGAGVSANVTSTYGMYAGAQLLIETGASSKIEEVTVTSVVGANQYIATFANNHAAFAPVWGATFPTQQDTDPIFTQAEMLFYVARAQNEFLNALPCYYQRFSQFVTLGNVIQSTPANAILIDRVASSAMNIGITSMVRSGNVVTLTAVQPHGLVKYNTFAVANPNPPNNLSNNSFLGVFAVASVPSPTTLTYVQGAANASATGGAMQQMMRLYELTQEELVQQNRAWQAAYVGPLQSWFEDRTGLYQWGVGGRPSSTFPAELLCALRDSDSLSLLDGFMVPDLLVHGIKYLALAYAWSKDGVLQQPKLAQYCLRRYAQVVMAAQRYIRAMKIQVGK